MVMTQNDVIVYEEIKFKKRYTNISNIVENGNYGLIQFDSLDFNDKYISYLYLKSSAKNPYTLVLIERDKSLNETVDNYTSHIIELTFTTSLSSRIHEYSLNPLVDD